MQRNDNMKIFLYPNLDKTNCFEYTSATCEILRRNGALLSMSEKYRDVFNCLEGLFFKPEEKCIKECDIIVAIGGDGTILKCAIKGSALCKPILGINCGRLGLDRKSVV